MPTVLQRIATLSCSDSENLHWKQAYKWAKERASDHMVHIIMPDGTKSERCLFEDYNLSQGNSLSNEQLVEMLAWFSMARMQYANFV